MSEFTDVIAGPGVPGDMAFTVTPDADEAVPPPRRGGVWRRFARNRLAVLGLVIIVILVLAAVFAPWITSFSPTKTDPANRTLGPSREHWFGTDRLGRDLFTRVVYGARVSLKIGLVATFMSMVIGVLLGALAGFFGGVTDTLLMRLTDIFLAIPYIILAVAIAVVFGRSENAVILVLGLTGWLAVARIVRSTFLALTKQEFTEAARALGFGRARIMFGHVLPNALQPIIVYGTLAVGGAILSEAALSFLSVGPQPPTPAWGLMVAEGKGNLANEPHLLFFPGGAIFLTVLAFLFVGDGLRDALDPRLKQ